MDTVSTKSAPRKKEEKEENLNPLLSAAAIKAKVEELRRRPADDRKGLPTDRQLKVHARRIRNASKRANSEMRGVSDQKLLSRHREARIEQALRRNLRDLERQGIDMSLSQYRASVGL